MEAHLFVFELGLLAFWGLWFSAIFLTNLFEGFRLMEIFPITWKWASQHFSGSLGPCQVSDLYVVACIGVPRGHGVAVLGGHPL